MSEGWKILVLGGGVALAAMPARAARLGHPGQSASGATSAQRQWNLLCDPAGATDGRTSTEYDPTVASFNQVNMAPGFYLLDLSIELKMGSDSGPIIFDANFPQSTPVTSFTVPHTPGGAITDPTSHQSGFETGFLQVEWSNTPPVGIFAQRAPNISVPSNDTVTHYLVFDDLNSDPNLVTTFTNYSDQGPNGTDPNKKHFPNADFYDGTNSDGGTFTYSSDPNSPFFVSPDGIPSASATFGAGTPEPATLSLLGVVAPLALRRVRRANPR